MNPWVINADEFPSEGTPEEKLWFALNYAVLAPSVYNTQPWLFRIRSISVQILADRRRSLPVRDPDGRELTMSCGAALYHLRLALQYFGSAPQVELMPEFGNADCLARLQIAGRCETDAGTILLFQAMPQRRTNRLPFRPEPVPSELLEQLMAAAAEEGAWLHVLPDQESRTAVADLVAEADRQQWADRNYRKELASWVRPAGVRACDGLAVSTQDLGNLMSHAGSLVIRTFDLGKGHSAKDRDIAVHSPALAVLCTETDDPISWLSAGQALARVLLRAASEGISSSFLSQLIAVPELRTTLGTTIGARGYPQLLLRLGYSEPVAPAPRRPVKDVLLLDQGHVHEGRDD
jgi:hypothetical protein